MGVEGSGERRRKRGGKEKAKIKRAKGMDLHRKKRS